jgi:predicted nucleotide-binding protein/ElaB/YqjD/DUF883 family membrane-anchored ribosome-binding protein
MLSWYYRWSLEIKGDRIGTMNYHVRITPREKNSGIEVMMDLECSEVEARFLVPYRQELPIIINGRTFDPGDIERIAIARSTESSGLLIDRIKSKRAAEKIFTYKPASWEIIEEAEDVTNQLISGPPGQYSVSDSRGVEVSRPPTGTETVFVVHGRNEEARKALFSFLRSISLDPLEWTRAVQATGKTAPYISEILDSAFSQAHAVIVLFTPDDEARLTAQLWGENEPDFETELRGQARPNVLFEAGMAMARDHQRTILVELGQLRPFSDIGGRHVIRLNNSTQQRQELAQRLTTAGCPVKLDGTDWHDAGDFEAAIESGVRMKPESTEAMELELRIANETQLSEEAKQLLKEAAKDEYRSILKARTAVDLIIQTNRKRFGESGDMISQAKWEQAIADLADGGYVRDPNGQGKSFEVTQKGFEVATVLGT